jgi:hypothetical protein
VKAAVRIGLALVLVLAPALCCCNVWWLASPATANPPASPACPACPTPVPAAHSCCLDIEATPPASTTAHDPTHNGPAPPSAPSCVCCDDRPDAALTEREPDLAGLRLFAGWLPVLWAVPPAVAPEHTGLRGGLDPPERAGVDARSAALFDRHVLRC